MNIFTKYYLILVNPFNIRYSNLILACKRTHESHDTGIIPSVGQSLKKKELRNLTKFARARFLKKIGFLH